jgi:hypothetical protein
MTTSCVVGPNPGGVINGASNNGFFTLTGVDNCPTSLYIIDDVTMHEFGPYPGDSVNFKWTEAPGSEPKQLDGRYVTFFDNIWFDSHLKCSAQLLVLIVYFSKWCG